MAAAGLAYETYTAVEPDPRVAVVEAGLRQFEEQGCDSLIGVGGGSSMDTAKAIAIWSRNPGRLRDYEGLDQFEQPPVPLFCAPTTVGTASEVTQFLVVTDPEAQFKFTIAGRMVPPLAAFLDPQLVLGLPAPITAATGMDALTHAIESYLSLLATPLTEALALHAIRLVGANLRPAVANSRNHGAMANMLVASCLAGMAFNATRLGNVHAMSHPVGAFFHVPHGVANAIILPHVMEFNALAVPRKLIEVGQALGEPVAETWGNGGRPPCRYRCSAAGGRHWHSPAPARCRCAAGGHRCDGRGCHEERQHPHQPATDRTIRYRRAVRAGAVARGAADLPPSRFPSGGGVAHLLTQQPGDGPGELLCAFQVRIEGVG